MRFIAVFLGFGLILSFLGRTHQITSLAQDKPEWQVVETLGQGSIEDALWLPDGHTLALFGGRGIWLYDVENLDSDPRLIESPAGWIRSAALAGDVLATGHQNGSVTLWDATTLTPTSQFQAEDTRIMAIALSNNGQRLITANTPFLHVWDVQNQQLIREIDTKQLIHDIATNRDGSVIAMQINETEFPCCYGGDVTSPDKPGLALWEVD